MNETKHEQEKTAATGLIKYWLTSLCLVVAAWVWDTPAIAQAVCVPVGNGGAYGAGPPVWWQAAGTGFARFNTWVDDPRWSGAASVTHGDGASHDVQFRALYAPQSGSPQYAYFSWWQKFALKAPSTANRLYVGVHANGGTTGTLLKVTFATNSPTTAAAGSAANVEVFSVDAQGNFGSPISPRPAWADDVRVWIDQVTDQTTQNPPLATNPVEAGNWAVHVRVPIGANLGDAANNVTLGTTFNLWYELLQGTSDVPVVAYTWPRPLPQAMPPKFFFVTTTAFVEKLPVTSDWPQIILGADESNSACKGVTLDEGDIGVVNATSGNDFTISTSQTNTFHAKPTNKSGADIALGDIHARFRIANWGVQPNTTDADPATANWNTVRGLGDVVQAGTPGTVVSNNAKWDISSAWLPDNTVAEEAGFFNGTKSPHQCVQVELSGPGNVNFLRSSAFRNMRVVSASVFNDKAVVSVVGLRNTPAGKRDVYLAVKKFNMPDVVRAEPGDSPPRDTKGRDNANGEQDNDVLAERERVAEFTEYERRFAAEPSYVVRGYYDTGERMKLDNVDRPILLPMVAFGYFVNHEGALAGWDDSLTGVERVGPDFYHVKVADGTTAPIQVRIEALEHGKAGGLGWWLWLLLVLILLIIIFIWRRRPSGP